MLTEIFTLLIEKKEVTNKSEGSCPKLSFGTNLLSK